MGAVVLGVLWWPCPASKYSEYVDRIEEGLSHAVQLHRTGQVKKAMSSLEKVRVSFQLAIKEDDSAADAYVAFAQAMLTTNQLNESKSAWEAALERIDAEKSPALAAWARGRLRWTRYGLVSMKRDQLYASGQGDLLESMNLVKEQLQIYPDFPSLYHDLATIQVMLHDFQDTDPVKNFRVAQEAAWKAWSAGLLERKRSKSCLRGRIFYDWHEAQDTALVSLKLDERTESGDLLFNAFQCFSNGSVDLSQVARCYKMPIWGLRICRHLQTRGPFRRRWHYCR